MSRLRALLAFSLLSLVASLTHAGTEAVNRHLDGSSEIDAPAFEIPMQGLGLFACRRAAWVGFNTRFRGFGAEEGYIHEKTRQHGGRTLCLPFLRAFLFTPRCSQTAAIINRSPPIFRPLHRTSPTSQGR